MMKTVLGPFHPHLENALSAEVRKHRSKDPLSPLLILVPSNSLRRRLKICLAAENRLNLLNVHLLTFHQLYLRLSTESRSRSDPAPVDDLILKEALSHWIRRGGTKTESFLPVVEKAGGCGALWQTLRDLKDGNVSPAHLAGALDEGLFDGRDKEKVQPLLDLYAGFIESCRRWGLYDYTDFVSSAGNPVRSSLFLKRFERIFYYGFYDLTQVQLDVFADVARSYPTTLFFPLMRGHPAWVFAQRFYERHIQGMASEEKFLCELGRDFCSLPIFSDDRPLPAPPTASLPRCALISCSAARDEILTVAKEILRLNRDEGLSFSEIGLVARTLEPYADWIKEVFQDHRIPISTPAEELLAQAPLAKAVLLLLNLAGKNYLRSHFIDLVSSSYFNLRVIAPEMLTPRPDLWDVLTRRVGITKGAEEWTRLKHYLDRDLQLSEANEEDDEIRTTKIASEQIGILWRLFEEVHRDLSRLPAAASWSRCAESWKRLLEKYLNLADRESSEPDSADERVSKTILETLAELAKLDPIQATISQPEFARTFERWLESKSVPISAPNVAGVNVLDAMAARGWRFRALFVVGFNEGLFPRTIREDAFLRDRTRRVMETVLGYKVSEKLGAFDEEKLLFALLLGAARERLFCLFRRSDETGAALEPSWYLAELRRIFPVETVAIPRGIIAKKDFAPFRQSDLLLPEELAIRMSLEGDNLEPLLKYFPRTFSLHLRGSTLLEFTENTHGRLSAYDGLSGHLSDYWERLSREGVAPTSLERYARCPFQFFAMNVLGLRRVERPEEQSVISTAEMGVLIHRILKAFFQELIDEGYFLETRRIIDCENLLEATARKIFRDYQVENPTGYALVWEIFQEEIMTLLKHMTALDLRELSRSGRRPVALEAELQGALPANWPAPASSLVIHGTLDRIDFEPSGNRFRVIDYKFKSGRKPSSADTNLLRAALRGERLQLPLYVLLAREYAKRQKTPAGVIEAAFYFLASKWDEGPFLEKGFSAGDWDGVKGQSLRETISFLIEGIRQGRYFIRPGPACDHCEVSHVCRKDHLPTAWRTANDPLTKAHFELARKDPPKSEEDD